jgi:Di-haem oxidoreductase, putative peroxidase
MRLRAIPRTVLPLAAAAAVPFIVATIRVAGEQSGPSSAGGAPDSEVVHADIVARGIPGAGAITQIGTFHTGGPFHDNAALINHSTDPGHVLDRTRLFVASTSNFGAPLAIQGQAEGSILSIDVTGGPGGIVDVTDAAFAASATVAQPHPATAGGRALLYAAQSPAFLNSVNGNTSTKMPPTLTSGLPTVSLPLGISLNNGFGRPWFANAPSGSMGDGTITVIDPNGAPLAGAPDPTAGGVFSGVLTNRTASSTHGITAAAVATALVTKSPDPPTNGRAVFLAALADGSIVQVHVALGVDGLAPNGSFTPISGISTENAESADPAVVTRAGMLFNWAPARVVFVSDPLADRILAFDLADDGHLFQPANLRYISSPALHTPVDLAPAVREVAARNFASNTTLGAGSDLYVLNRGNNTVVRMRQDGDIVAVRQVESDVADLRVAGLAVSEDARTIWITATAPDRQGFVLRIPAFGAGDVTTSLLAQAAGDNASAQGRDIFAHALTTSERVGPLFNGRSCNSCHNSPAPGGMGASPDTFVTRVARINNGFFDPLSSHGGPIARQHSIAELGEPCGIPTGVPPEANATSVRSAMTLRGTSLIDNILTSQILAAAADPAVPAAMRGRPNILTDGRVGRFGWKAQTATLVEFMGEALRDEMGLTNPIAPRDLVRGCGASIAKPEADAVPLTSTVAFLNTIEPPVPAAACVGTTTSPSAGTVVFGNTGCATCHKPSYIVPGSNSVLAPRLYSDLLLHDMGAGLADGFEQGSSTGREFRTAPLWRVSDRSHFLHDGRAATILDAILAHGGQAAGAVAAFNALSATDKQAILDLLGCI